MGLVSPTIALFIFGVIVVISILAAAWFKNYPLFDRGSFHVFIVVLSGLGVVVTFMFYYNLVQLQNQDQQMVMIENLTRIDDALNKNLTSVFREISTIVPGFVLSLHPLQTSIMTGANTSGIGATGVAGTTDVDTSGTGITGANVKDIGTTGTNVKDIGTTGVTGPLTAQAQIAIITTSANIFALWQDVILTHHVLRHEMRGYSLTFLQWAHSPTLAEQWHIMGPTLDRRSQTYGRLLFRYGAIEHPTITAYQEAVDKLLTDVEYTSMMC